ncbi:hypothetical protein EDC01DRAFT_666508 [Geopyxis carbonaria]|nr:hypothetical protein EDC01DRAFT_666508 [Geopyxis carbonaria]
MRPSALLAALVALPLTLADLEFKSPTSSTKWTGGNTVTIEWDESGSPGIDDFTTFNLFLCCGSNATPLCLQALGPNPQKMASSAKVQIPSAAADDGTDVFFVKLEATAATGGAFTVYSDRFSLTGMTGKFDAAAIAAQEVGDTDPPPSVDGTVADAAPKDGGAKEAQVPYTKQTGQTRYAPMQLQPAKTMRATAISRQYPTSAYSVFNTKIPRPNVQTTITMTWTYKVTTKINTASPAPQPGTEKQKVLARWRDQ